MEERGVLYLMIGGGDRQRLNLLTSLATLRPLWSGPVAVLTDRPADLAGLPLAVHPLPDAGWRDSKHRHFEAKSRLPEWSPFDSTVFLDCDTLVVGDIAPLFRDPDDPAITVTQLADWTTGHTQMRHRLGRLVIEGLLCPERANALIAANSPAINSGVMAFSRAFRSPRWHPTTQGLNEFFLHDELALQLLLPSMPHRIVDDRWNCLPQFSKRPPEEVVIWHCGGRVFGHPKTAALYYATLRSIWRNNFGGVRSWLKCNPELWDPI